MTKISSQSYIHAFLSSECDVTSWFVSCAACTCDFRILALCGGVESLLSCIGAFHSRAFGKSQTPKEFELLRAAFQGTKCSFSSLQRAVLNLSWLGFTLCRSVPERHATHSPTGGFSRCSSECLADLPKAGRDQEESINPRNQLQARCQACLAGSKNLFRTWPGESEPLRLSSQRKRLNREINSHQHQTMLR